MYWKARQFSDKYNCSSVLNTQPPCLLISQQHTDSVANCYACAGPDQDMAINLAPIQTNILSTSAENRAGEHFWGHVPKLQIIFGEILSHVVNQSLP